MSWLRTSMMGLREARPTSSVFMRPVSTPLTDKAKKDIDELLAVTDKLLAGERTTLFDDWCVADADLARRLMRLVANNDPVPQRIADYVGVQWSRHSVRRYLAHIPTTT
jgi:glutathione S-transferase